MIALDRITQNGRPDFAPAGAISRPWLRLAAALAVVLLTASSADACSVPVFRYALERWSSDLFEVDVFYRSELTPEQRAAVSQLEDQSQVNGGAVNWEVVHCNLDEELAEDLQALGDTLGDVSLPHVVLRRPGGRRGSAIVWSGPLSDAKPSLWTSPARDELIRRLAEGDSVVWLVFPGSDKAASRQIVKRLQEQLPELAAEIPLPAGIGLPGSELLTQLPLEVRFSVLEVDGKSADEAIFRKLVTRGVVEDVGDDESIVVPVFGRGRAMTALKANSIDDALLAECSGFLCGACSCQVKQSNPGFDLLLAVNWDERLWEDADVLPETSEPEPKGEAGGASDEPVPDEPVYVPIPTGQKETPAGREEAAADRKKPAASEPQATSGPPVESQPDHVLRWAALGIAALVIGLVLGFRRSA
jgi:hypothetical protein